MPLRLGSTSKEGNIPNLSDAPGVIIYVQEKAGRAPLGDTETDDLGLWLTDGYARSYRTACLILGNRSDAEEAVQEAFLRAWRFRSSLGQGSDVRPWLYRVVVNTCNSKLRTEIPHRSRRLPDGELEHLPASDEPPSGAVESNDVARALRDLPTHLRVVVVLRYYAGLTEREIATAIGKRQGTVKSRLHDARRQLAAHPALRSEIETRGSQGSEALR
jgi:RNA polymerase sigma-70 factor (ECF subfamily)